MHRLDGKVAIITGAARGMGESEARLFAEEGAKVVIADLRDDLGSAVAKDLGASAVFAHLDVSDPLQWSGVIEATLKRWGRIDILVNNAGIAPNIRPFEQHTLDDFRRLISVNLIGVWNGMMAVFPTMREQRAGSIVNVSSVTVIFGSTEGEGGYSATKHAVLGLTKNAACEWARYGIRVNTLIPGTISTPLQRGEDADHDTSIIDHDELIRRIPMERAGDAREIAQPALFLASDESSYVSGADLVVDGAISAAIRLPRKAR